MKKYRVVLTKSYLVTVRAKTQEDAMRIAEFYTGDSQDISIDQDRKKYGFAIEQIECAANESSGLAE